jgi:flagellar hook protein FlgE
VNNQVAASPPQTITGATLLSGAAGSDSLTTGFSAGAPPGTPADTITVDGTTITFVASGATGNELNVTDSVSTLLAKIDSLTGGGPTASSVVGGQVIIHTGYQQDLSISSSNASALAALGLAGGVTTPRLTTGAGTVTANDQQTFLNESISGGAVTAYDSTGTAVNLQLRWAKVDSSSLGGTNSNTWNLFYQSDPGATGTQVAWTNAGTNFTFSASGALVSPSSPAITIPNVAVGNQSLGNLSFSMGSGSLTQYASTGGTATINAVTQNGYAAGQLQSVAINNDGIVVGTFSNGQNLDLASVTLSHFNGTNYLKALDGGAYAVTEQSGPAIIGASGTIAGSSLEGSNTDIASEFTKLIVTQQAYSANTKVITTANSMVQDLLNVLR